MIENLSSLRDHLSIREKTEELVGYFTQKAFDETWAEVIRADLGVEYLQFYANHLLASAQQNVDAIYSTAQSPIEHIFLNSLHLCFIKAAELNAFFSRSSQNHLQYMDDYSSFHTKLDARFDEFKRRHPSGTISEFLQKAQRIYLDTEKSEMPEETRSRIEQHLYVGRTFFHNNFHFTLQPELPTIRHGKSGMRPDLFIWVPTVRNIRYVVECDGYTYHAHPPKFTEDRQRDRILDSHGIACLRFSGHEIHHRPVETATELFERLEQISDENQLGPK